MKIALERDVSKDAMRAALKEIGVYTRRSEHREKHERARVAMTAFLHSHGVRKVMHLPPAQRTHFLVFLKHLMRLVLWP